MSKEFLADRKHALEEAFFAQQDQALLHRVREAAATRSKREALSTASGIADPAILEKLVALGVDGATMAALTLVPLVLVAWADGEMDEKERAAVLTAAVDAGIEDGGPGHQLLDRWLAKRPPPHMLATWTGYIRALAPTLSEGARQQLKADLLGRARKVSEAAGGFLGAGWKTSPAEREVLAKLEKAFSA